MKDLLIKLISKNLTISFAESLTGGYLSASLTKHAGASKSFKGAIIAYSNEAKINVLKVDEKLINDYSVVSREVSIAMAKGLKNIIESDIYIAVTGNAGPTLENNTNKLNCFVTIIYKDEINTFEIIFKNNNRKKNIKTTIKFVKNIVNKVLL